MEERLTLPPSRSSIWTSVPRATAFEPHPPATSAGPIRRPHRIASHRVAVSKYMPPIDHDPSVRGRRSGWARLGDKCSAYVRTRSLAMHGGKGEDAEPGGTDHCEYCA